MLIKTHLLSPIGQWAALFDDKDLVFLGSDYLGWDPLQVELKKFVQANFANRVDQITEPATPLTWNWQTPPPLKLLGTPFQLKVWTALSTLPPKTLVTYSEVALMIDQPTAVRAVATAIAKNPIAFWIPCHRVIHKQKKLIGYRWGSPFKSQVYQFEQQQIC